MVFLSKMRHQFLATFCWCFILNQSVFSLSVNLKDITDGVNNAVRQHFLDSNFENGSLDPWKDESDNGAEVRWIVEDFWSVSSSLRPPPLEPIGSSNRKYLRLERQLGGSFGVAVLQSPFFLGQPGDVLTFSYWMRSRYNQMNNIQVYKSTWFILKPIQIIQLIIQVFLSGMDGAEKLLIDLSSSSGITNNNKWIVTSKLIPVELATEIRVSVTTKLFHYIRMYMML